MKIYVIVLVLTLFGILSVFSPESKANPFKEISQFVKTTCLVDESADVTGTTVDCSNYYNAKLDTNTDLTYCCEDANRRPKFQEINIDSGTTLFSCMCLPDADDRGDVGDENNDDNA
ncbi:hypothetical protein PoB_005470100 [Plakobranchus ocellatus]|uniref:Uncharacterized protein n=1 Tax=Plakobranchus ocellatus TaxID=259542 RepID=A0AAV4BYH7_9GAST|nr:hypothetical protein PoB_005470100 [Plakobranchus ocellatus]